METEPWELPARTPAAPPPSPGHGLATGPTAEPWELPSHSLHDVPTEPVPLLPDDATGPAESRADARKEPERGPLRASSRMPVRHPRRAPGARGVPVAGMLAVALVTLGGAALVARHPGGDAGPAADAASTSGPPPTRSTGPLGGSGVVAGASTTARSSRSGGAVDAGAHDLHLLVARVRVPATAPPARDAAGVTVTYSGSHLIDGNPSTAWRMRGDARGRSLTLTFSRPVRLARVGLVNGYAKVDAASGTDRYTQQRRVTRVVWRAGTSARVPQALVDGVRAPQLVALATPPIRTLTLTIVTTTRAEPRFDYTALGEIVIEGR